MSSFPSNPGLYDNSDRERVRDASDIVRIVGEHVALKAKGREYVGLCPFHNDHNPSMRIVPAKGIFHCFVCGTGGDVFTFVRKIHNMEFREALEYLADRAGIKLTPRRALSEGAGAEVTRTDLLNACAAARDYFRAVYADPGAGQLARDIVSRRKISEEMVERFQIGMAPNSWDMLGIALRRKGIREPALVGSGIVKPRDGGEGSFSYLRNRLVFPIHDQIGRVIAFGGRKIDEADEPKYLNSPDTRLFNKSATLFGLSQSAKTIQATKTALITEGYTDAIACHQAGFSNAVATLGTALTREHATILRRLCDRVVLLFDGDDAGQRAADRAVPIFFAEPLDVTIVTLGAYTDAKDPDELLKREGGSEVFRRALDGGIDLLDYRFNRLRRRLDGAGMAALSRAIDDEIGQIVAWGLRDVPPVRQALIIRRLAELAGVGEDSIRRAIPAGRSAPGGGRESRGSGRPASGDSGDVESGAELAAARDSALAEVDFAGLLAELRAPGLGPRAHLLGCILARGVLWAGLSEADHALIAPGAYPSVLLARVAEIVADIGHRGDPPDLGAVLAETEDAVIQKTAVALHARVDVDTQSSEARLDQHWKACLDLARRDSARPSRAVGNDLAAQIELKRRMHADFGADRRVLPKPSA